MSADPLAAVTPTYLFYLGRSACGRNECRRRVVVARRTALNGSRIIVETTALSAVRRLLPVENLLPR